MPDRECHFRMCSHVLARARPQRSVNLDEGSDPLQKSCCPKPSWLRAFRVAMWCFVAVQTRSRLQELKAYVRFGALETSNDLSCEIVSVEMGLPVGA